MDDPKFQLFTGNDDQFYFRLRAGNGKIILQSEGYEQKGGATNGIDSVKEHAPHDKNYQRLTSVDDEPYFNLRADNYKVIGTSEMYSSNQAMETGIAAVKDDAPTAPTEDLTE